MATKPSAARAEERRAFYEKPKVLSKRENLKVTPVTILLTARQGAWSAVDAKKRGEGGRLQRTPAMLLFVYRGVR